MFIRSVSVVANNIFDEYSKKILLLDLAKEKNIYFS